MKREEHTSIIRQIRENLNNEGMVSELLANLSDDYGAILAVNEDINNELSNLRAANENLRDTNMRLFLRVGESVPQEDVQEPEEQAKLSIEEMIAQSGITKF